MKNQAFTLCESTLRKHTRDVYGQNLRTGSWQYTVIHDGPGDLNLTIRELDDNLSKWSQPPIQPESDAGNEIKGVFTKKSDGEVKFIFSSQTPVDDINYRCEVALR